MISQNFDFEFVWKSDKNAELIHFIGKDIINFHCLFWPSMLKTAGFRVPSEVRVHGFVTVNGRKMSKSRGTFIHARQYLDHLNPEYLRYYFASKISNKLEDVDLNLSDFIAKVNSDLVGKLINIASRTAKFLEKYFNNVLSRDINEVDLIRKIYYSDAEISRHYENGNYNRVIKIVMAHADEVNSWISMKEPWKNIKIPGKAEEVHKI